MPPNYKNSKIYAIRSHQTDLIYIGSTTETLYHRFANHKRPTNICKSKEILQYPDAYIELIEEYPCDNKEQLNKKEGEHIRSNNCVNKNIAGRTKNEYYHDNNEKLLQQKRQRYHQNREKLLQQKRQYYHENHEKICKRRRDLYKTKKSEIVS